MMNADRKVALLCHCDISRHHAHTHGSQPSSAPPYQLAALFSERRIAERRRCDRHSHWRGHITAPRSTARKHMSSISCRMCSRNGHRNDRLINDLVTMSSTGSSNLIFSLMWLQPCSSSTTRRQEKHRCHPFSAANCRRNWVAVSWPHSSPLCSAPLHIAHVLQ